MEVSVNENMGQCQGVFAMKVTMHILALAST